MKSFPTLAVGVASALLLAACGGGGDNAGGPPPTISATSASGARYSDPMLITLTGTNLEQSLTFTGNGCRNFVRSTTAPFVSTATLAYYTCTVSGVGAQSIGVVGGGITVGNVTFTIAQPQVTVLVNNGAGVSGTMIITLRPQEAPITVDNFLAYVKSGFYNTTVFHRHGRARASATDPTIVPFVLQGGGFVGPLTAAAAFGAPKPVSAPIALEARRGLSNLRYTVAMARTGEPNSATAQFFINTADNAFLDGTGAVGNEGYAVFGTITTGTTVVDAMVAAPCTLSPVNFNDSFSVSIDCLPVPNLVITNAAQSQ